MQQDLALLLPECVAGLSFPPIKHGGSCDTMKVTSAGWCQGGGTGSKEVLECHKSFPRYSTLQVIANWAGLPAANFCVSLILFNKWEQFSMLGTKRRHCEGNILKMETF